MSTWKKCGVFVVTILLGGLLYAELGAASSTNVTPTIRNLTTSNVVLEWSNKGTDSSYESDCHDYVLRSRGMVDCKTTLPASTDKISVSVTNSNTGTSLCSFEYTVSAGVVRLRETSGGSLCSYDISSTRPTIYINTMS